MNEETFSGSLVAVVELPHSVFVARFGEKAVFGRGVLVRAQSQYFGGSLWRESRFWESRAGGS